MPVFLRPDGEASAALGSLASEGRRLGVFTDAPEPHVPLASLPGMAERTVKVGSAGKIFSLTGWKVGWVHGPPALVAAVRAVKQFLTYTNGSPFQPAVARTCAWLPVNATDPIWTTPRRAPRLRASVWGWNCRVAR